MRLIIDPTGPFIEFKTKDGSTSVWNIRAFAEESGDETLLRWCYEQLGREPPSKPDLKLVSD